MKKLISKALPILLVLCLLAGCKNIADGPLGLLVGLGNSTDGPSGTGSDSVISSLEGDAAKMAELFGEDYVVERLEWEEKNNPYEIPADLKGTTVEFATWLDPRIDICKYAVAIFEETTGMKLQWVEIPQTGYTEKLASLVASGSAPDVYFDNGNQFTTVLKLAKPLDEVKSINLEDPIWDKDVLKYTTFNGHPYEINTRNSLNAAGDYIVFYNKRILEENGVKTPAEYIEEGAWTIDAMINVMREYSALGDNYYGGYVEPQYLAAASGTAIIKMENGRFVSGLNDAALHEAYKKYIEWNAEGLFNASAITGGIVKGTHGLVLNTTYGLKAGGTFKGVDGDMLGFAPIPSVDGSATSYTAAKWNAYGILNNSKNPEGAGYFLRCMLDPYNYNIDEIFISTDARDYYFKNACGTAFDKKVFMYDQSITPLLGYAWDNNGLRTWDYKLMRTKVAQFATTVASIENEVTTGVNKANEILDGLKK